MKILTGVNVQPFTRLQYASEEAKKYWEPVIQRASTAAHRAETEMVKRRKRRCATMHIPNVGSHHVLGSLAGKGLKFGGLKTIKNVPGFQHTSHSDAKPDDADASVFGVVARTKKDLRVFAAAYNQGDHSTMGSLLGFPECCRDFFISVWPGYCDPIWQSAEKDADTHTTETSFDGWMKTHTTRIRGYLECNAMLRYFGPRLSFHIPCSPTCENSRVLGQEYLEVIKDMDEAGHEALIECLSLPLSWDVLKGVVCVTTPAFRGWANSLEAWPRHVVQFTCREGLWSSRAIPGAASGMGFPFDFVRQEAMKAIISKEEK